MTRKQKHQQREERTQRTVEETGDVERSPATQKMTNQGYREINRNQVEDTASETRELERMSGDEGLIDVGTSIHEPTERAHRAADDTRSAAGHSPKRGETYRCESCGMEVKVTASCNCQDGDERHFQCCGRELARV